MDTFKEYGFTLTDINNVFPAIKYNEFASNIREFCFAIAAKTTEYDKEAPLALAMNWRGNLDVSIYSDSNFTFFGVYNSAEKKIVSEMDVSEFRPSAKWFERFLGRCEHRILEREQGNIDATIHTEIHGAWKTYLLTLGDNAAGTSNIPCRSYDVAIDPTPHFIDVVEEDLD